ncbi:hypothetical protein [Mangrovimonas sp. DI 80]|uniref:hypothetical protein n=1 Tax=Mangrovimonas sp. DI 80 TaxID=1779330 RepID=UPI000976FB5C|nr:hypothetical protein [Mangrovimonas sp. DI 80]OMP31196.1 hypothetical protein BKM32_09050 [Mangrovimonas sp. DI 80]
MNFIKSLFLFTIFCQLVSCNLLPSKIQPQTADLGEAIKMNTNKEVMSKVTRKDSLVNFSYQSKISTSIFGGSSSSHTLIVKLFPFENSEFTSNTYLQTRSSEIKNVLDQEMTTLSNFDAINFQLISHNKQIQNIILEL